jgi:aminobenzoyl-glutamate utilization protein B
MQNTHPVWTHVDAHADAAIALSDRVWETPELCYNEHRSAAEHTAFLREHGFRVTETLAGIPTAMMGEAGEGGPVIAILGEFDALPGLSNEAGVAEHRPIPGDGNGHACGHNLLGAGALLAATAVKDHLAAHGIRARVRYYGCPAEEGGAAKGFMAREGLFDDVDLAISWHPASFAAVNEAKSLANTRIDFTFHGRAAHAASAPHLGRSALDAVELMNIGVNYLREHIPDGSRIHYAYLDAGGVAPNVVQARAKVRYLIRAADVAALNRLVPRVRQIAEGAALMTETRVETQVISAVSNLVGNRPLELLMQEALDRLGPPPFDAADEALAARFHATQSDEDIATAFRKYGLPRSDAVLAREVVPLDSPRAPMIGSTDVGDVSWAVPTVQMRGATLSIGTSVHSWQATAQGKSAHAHKGMVHAAKVMAATAVEALARPEVIAAAKAEHRERTGGRYVSPLPPDAKPALGMSLAEV